MITTKQRAYLRSLANKIEPIFQLGKGGIEAPFLSQIEAALEKREIVKLSVLDNSGMDPREASDMICSALGCEGVQVIGNKIVLYKKSKNNPKIELPR